MFDPTRPPSTPIPAATVILTRDRRAGGDAEIFLVRRHRKSGFMSDAFVFPGGKIDPGDGSPEVAALRELFEEAGVLMAEGTLDADRRASWRARLNTGEATFEAMLAAEGLRPQTGRLHAWSRWITPSVEPKRFDARFFVAELPPGQTPSFDAKETVEEAWLTPAEALERHAAGALRLPPPQVKTMTELLPHAERGVRAIAEAAARRPHEQPILPRFAQLGEAVTLLLPWDPEYQTAGVGEGIPIPSDHVYAGAPSRFVMEGMSWRLEFAPGRVIA